MSIVSQLLRRTPVAGAFTLLLLAAPSASWAVCGDNHIDGHEQCDGADLGGQTCKDVTAGFAQTGTLSCRADCTLDTTDCRRAFIESLVPATAGPGKNRCHIEWGTVGTAAKGRSERICSEGDPTCDQDESFNNTCAIRVQLCLDVPDPRISGCAPARIVRLEVLQPRLTSSSGQQVASSLLAAAKGLAPDQAHASGNAVSYGPPITSFSCGSGTIRIPLRGTTGHARPGKVLLRARTSDNSGRVRAIGSLRLTCNP